MVMQLSPKDWESLSAYLDSQLTGRELKQLESRLLTQPGLAAELEALRHTKKVLGHLPRYRVPRNFTLSADMARSRVQPRFFPVARLASLMAGLLLVLSFVGEWAFSNQTSNSAALVMETPTTGMMVAHQDRAVATQPPTLVLPQAVATEAPAVRESPAVTEPAAMSVAAPPAAGAGALPEAPAPAANEAPVVIESQAMPMTAPQGGEKAGAPPVPEESPATVAAAMPKAAPAEGMAESLLVAETPYCTETSSPLATEPSEANMFVVPITTPEAESAESMGAPTLLPEATTTETPQTIYDMQITGTPEVTQPARVDNAQTLLLPDTSPTSIEPGSMQPMLSETPLSTTDLLVQEAYGSSTPTPDETAVAMIAESHSYLVMTPTAPPTVTNTLAARKAPKTEPTSTTWIVIANPTEEPLPTPMANNVQVKTATVVYPAAEEQGNVSQIVASPTAMSTVVAPATAQTGAIVPVQPPVAERPVGEVMLEWLRSFRTILVAIMFAAGILAVYWWRKRQ